MIKKLVKVILISIVILFFFNTYKLYISEVNMSKVSENIEDIDKKLNTIAANLEILKNDTDDVIEFNRGFNNINKKANDRKFWELINKK